MVKPDSISKVSHGRWIAVAAMDENRVIGRDGELPWHLPGDLRFFKELTSGGTVLMGRKTFESIGRPLPKRRNLVLTRSGFAADGVEVCSSLENLDRVVSPEENVFIIGGAEIYRATLPIWDEVYLTMVAGEHDGDTYFPEFEDLFSQGTIVHEGEGFIVRHFLRMISEPS